MRRPLAVLLVLMILGVHSAHALDQNGDGMSDVWQRLHNITNGDTASDPDGDGHRNIKEAEAGTDPRNPQDYFRTFNFSFSPAFDSVSLSWRSLEAHYYEIEQSTDLNSWSYASSQYGQANQTTSSRTFSLTSPEQPKMFFRVRSYPEYDYDADGDGLQLWEERLIGTDPTDYDGDTDNDGMADGFEFIHQLNPLDAADAASDLDADGLSNLWEYKLRLNPRLTDSNSNGISDALEDREQDGLANLVELTIHNTDPSQPDTDMDTLPDGWELANGFDPTVHNGTDGDITNDANSDPDGDGLNNSQEADNESKAKSADNDGDGVDDGVEVGQGSNPNDPNDSQPPPTGTAPVNVTFGDDSGSHSEKYRVKLTPLAGDPGGPRSRTNRAYGASQTDTFQLPKGAKYKVELIHIGTKPGFREEHGFSNFDWTLDIDTSANCLVVEDPNTIMTTVDDWPNSTFKAEGKDATLYVPQFEWITPRASPVSAANEEGDGQNEFTYSAASPGVLTMDIKVWVKPTGTAGITGHDGVKFSDRCFYKLPTINGSTFAWDGANTGGKSAASGEHLIAKATYTTLPAANAEFGLKQAEFECDGHTDTLAKGDFEVFFPKDEKNHPGVGAGTTPNWYFYWAGTAVTGYDLTSGTYSYAAGAAGNYAEYNGNPAVPHYTIHGPASAGHEQYTSAGLNVNRKGIDTLACTLVHEKTHRQVDQNWLAGGIWHGKADLDGDELPDDWEDANVAIGYDKNNRFSFAGFPYGDDEEVYCEYAANGTTGDASKDWANPGKQSKNQF